QGQGRQVEQPLLQVGEALVQMVGQIDRADGEDRIAGQPHQQHPVVAHGSGGGSARPDANNRASRAMARWRNGGGRKPNQARCTQRRGRS
ncbi:MAG: hypothetical protein ACK56I_09795, partial [bacterium]